MLLSGLSRVNAACLKKWSPWLSPPQLEGAGRCPGLGQSLWRGARHQWGVPAWTSLHWEQLGSQSRGWSWGSRQGPRQWQSTLNYRTISQRQQIYVVRSIHLDHQHQRRGFFFCFGKNVTDTRPLFAVYIRYCTSVTIYLWITELVFCLTFSIQSFLPQERWQKRE